MIAAQPYIAVDPYLMRARGLCVEKCEQFNMPGMSEAQRNELLKDWLSLTVREPKGHTEGVYVMKPFICEYVRRFFLGCQKHTDEMKGVQYQVWQGDIPRTGLHPDRCRAE